MFAVVGRLRSKQIQAFLIFSQTVHGNWWPSFNLSLIWNISAITTQSLQNSKLGSSKERQDFKLQRITSYQGRSKRREGYRRGKKKECAKLRVIREQKYRYKGKKYDSFFSDIPFMNPAVLMLLLLSTFLNACFTFFCLWLLLYF